MEQLLAWLDEADEPPALADLAYTLATGREALPCRWEATVASIDALRSALRDGLASPVSKKLRHPDRSEAERRTCSLTLTGMSRSLHSAPLRSG